MYLKRINNMLKKENTLFLLGGHDLEMLTIKKVLKEKGFTVIDHELSWGAKLSSYTEVLKEHQDKTIYGVELIEDIAILKNYHAIDHHNEQVDKASSLFQVLEFLELKPTREHELISANDVGHIEAMKCLGATAEEIKSIRQQERTIQGVTAKDELQAQKESEAVVEKNGISIIETTLDAFSPIVDNYEKRPLLVYSQKSLTYYGDIVFLKEKYKKQIENKEAYHGRGYFGFDTAYVGLVTPNILVNEIVEVKEKNIISYHNFMFPFIFDNNNKKEIDKQWNYKNFVTNNQKSFNEKVYFYKHVQDALFNTKGKDEKKFISKYYEYEESQGTYVIDCKKGNFELELDGISLRVFNTGVAILSFNLLNTKYEALNDVLAINDFGRRIYPQFLGENFTKETQESFLANSIGLNLENKEVIVENFEDYNDFSKLKNGVKLPSFIEKLIGNSFSDIRYVIDDRMFVISQYHNDDLINTMNKYDDKNKQYCYENNDLWYQYLFIDGNGKNCQSKHMSQKLIKESTYDRWIEWGTLFGLSRYSFVTLTGSEFGKNILLPHMQTMYFQMFSLLLAYRATIIKFADDIQEVTQGLPMNISDGTSSLYKNYLDFMNQLYFKEVTAQDQGIELYEQAVKIMKIEVYLKDLDNEISELHTYVEMIAEKRRKKEEELRNQRLEKISELGAVFLPPTLLAGIYGMNIFAFNDTLTSVSIGLFSMVLVMFLGYGSVKKKIKPLFAILGMIGIIGGSVFYIGQKPAEPKSNLEIKTEIIEEKK